MNRETSAGVATISQLCRAFGVSRQAYYKALTPAARASEPMAGPQRSRWVTAEEASKAISRLAGVHPSFGVRKIWACLRREGLHVSRKRVWALMRSLGLCVPAEERRARRPMGQVTVPGSNRRWATDMTTVWTRRDGWVAVMPVVDCGDRVLLALEASKSQTALALLAPVEHALERVFGERKNVPANLELRTDHGPQYTGLDCERLCWRWQIDHTYAPVGRPTGNAIAERAILTLKTDLVWTQDWETLEELQVALSAWIDVYNTQRPHQALDWMTPAEWRAKNLGLATAAKKAG